MERRNGWDLSTHQFGLSTCLPARLHPFLIYYLTATCKTDNHPLPLTQSTSRDFNSSQLLFFLLILKLQPFSLLPRFSSSSLPVTIPPPTKAPFPQGAGRRLRGSDTPPMWHRPLFAPPNEQELQ
jgi:hypothetical protein